MRRSQKPEVFTIVKFQKLMQGNELELLYQNCFSAALSLIGIRALELLSICVFFLRVQIFERCDLRGLQFVAH